MDSQYSSYVEAQNIGVGVSFSDASEATSHSAFKKAKFETSEDSLINLSLAPVDINGRDATDDNVANPDHLDPKNRRLTKYVALVIPETS